MKQLQSKFMPLVMAGLGVVGFALRKGLYGVALDHKNLLTPNHPLQWALFLVTAGALALGLLYARGRGEALCGRKLRALGCAALAAGILLSVVPEGFGGSSLLRLRGILGLLAAAAMIGAAVQNIQGKSPFFLLPGLSCVFFAVHMVSCYQGWSSDPQIMDYLYTLFAAVCLMLFAYQQTACAAQCGNGKLLRFFGALGVFCAITALSGMEYPMLYLGGGIWAAVSLLCPEETE